MAAVSAGIARSSANAADICGDIGAVWQVGARRVVLVVDGLGHGVDAAIAATAAADYVATHLDNDLPDLFAGMNEALTSTRGAAVGVAVLDQAEGAMKYAGIGNTRAALFGWSVRRLTGNPGIVGAGFRRLTVMELPYAPEDRLILWSDGLEERLSVSPELERMRDNQALAEQLLEQYRHGVDDACAVVVDCGPL